MSAKSFFKGNAFKCLAVLSAILLLSGVLLSICWGFLEVTDSERFQNKITAIYDGRKVTPTEVDLAGKNTAVGKTKIEKMWYIEEDKDYLVQATARGYNGNITSWVIVEMKDGTAEVEGVGKVLLYKVASTDELTNNIPSYVYTKFSEDYEPGKVFEYGYDENGANGEDFISTHASFTMTAICNTVNGAVKFVGDYASGSVGEDLYAAFTHKDNIDMEKTGWTVSGETVTYKIKTNATQDPAPFTLTISVDATKTITSYTIDVNGTTENYPKPMSEEAKNLTGKTLADVEGYLSDQTVDGALKTGATKSNTQCFEAAAFALANYELSLTTPKEVPAE